VLAGWAVTALALGLGAPGLAADPASPDSAPPAPPVRPVVLEVPIASPIHPMVARHLGTALERARELDAEAVLVRLDTPGGSLPSTREMARALLGSPVPVVVWVGPAGARAASAGFFLLLAADVAAMAPGTQTGAAHPVGGGGEDIEGHMGEKIEQDTLALVRSLAVRHGRDVELAQAAVKDSRSFTAQEALDAGLVDYLAADPGSLLESLDGLELVSEGAPEEGETSPRTLRTSGAERVVHAMPLHQRLLAAIAHPQVAGLLMALGLLGLYAEISNPGALVPGVVGAICTLLGFFALSVLPIDYAGLALLALALALFVAETQVPAFGVLTAGGAVSLTLGLMMLFDDLGPTLRPHPAWAVGIGVCVFAIAAFGSARTLRLRRQRPTTGIEGMVGQRGTVRGILDPAGRVFVHGELWSATVEPEGGDPGEGEHIEDGAAVEVVAVEGLRLRVRPVHPDAVHPDAVS
jgi:membrane-bound serine protease (ClpP class)